MRILDLSAGNRAIWFDKNHPLATYLDRRAEVNPTIVADTRDLRAACGRRKFDLFVFDPPHMNCGRNSNMSRVYGYHTTAEILDTIEKTALEAHRVGKKNSLMAFKWNTHDLPLKRILLLMQKWAAAVRASHEGRTWIADALGTSEAEMLNGLDLFSGIGGLSMALSPWVRPLAYCERDRWAQAELLSRMRGMELPFAPIWDDVSTFVPELLPRGRTPDLIYGGFPCQDISVAGAGAGLGGSRSGLFFEIVRLTRELRPRFVFLENVPAITVRGLDRVLLELTALGYDSRWTIVSAAEVGAPHLRERWFILAHAGCDRVRDESIAERWGGRSSKSFDDGAEESVAYPSSKRARELPARSWEGRKGTPDSNRSSARLESSAHASSIGGIAGRWGRQESQGQSENTFSNDWWAAEPNVGRVAHGVPLRVDRLRGLGNAVVPLQARIAFERLIGIEGGQ